MHVDFAFKKTKLDVEALDPSGIKQRLAGDTYRIRENTISVLTLIFFLRRTDI